MGKSMLVNMNDILLPAKEGKYGVGFFNAVNVEMARAIIETAEELQAPVMVGTAEVLLPATELNLVADYLIPMAKKASVPVCVHYDHDLTFSRCTLGEGIPAVRTTISPLSTHFFACARSIAPLQISSVVWNSRDFNPLTPQ